MAHVIIRYTPTPKTTPNETCRVGDALGLLLANDRVALIDPADYELARPFRWIGQVCRGAVYARAFVLTPDGRKCCVLLHRLLFGLAPTDRTKVDHRDHDGLNNRRDNLRLATHTQNLRNSRKLARCSSRFKGVHRDSRPGVPRPWIASIKLDKMRHLGCFATEEAAALAYNVAALEHFGEFAFVNDLTPD